jgi:hypothetical protein
VSDAEPEQGFGPIKDVRLIVVGPSHPVFGLKASIRNNDRCVSEAGAIRLYRTVALRAVIRQGVPCGRGGCEQ